MSFPLHRVSTLEGMPIAGRQYDWTLVGGTEEPTGRTMPANVAHWIGETGL